ncbi:ABC transporter permease subunit [Photobacterium indicum]|jgi:phosphate transport system permease protein|uniref:ABC transporter permease subunit n=1 Tax=Photobacterium indicum TaxID=81447 RepID=UPI003D0A069A
MASASAFLLGENRGRRLRDRLVRFGVTAGGISVLITLVLIFFYLLYVTLPIFSSVTVKPRNITIASFPDTVAAVGVEENNDFAFRFSKQGELTFVSLKPEDSLDPIISQHSIANNPVSFAQSLPRDAIFAYGQSDGFVNVVKPIFQVSFPGNKRISTASVSYPLGQSRFLLDPQGQAIVDLAISSRDSEAIIVGKTADSRIVAMTFKGQDDALNSGPLNTGSIWQPHSFEITDVPQNINEIIVTPDGRTVYLRSGNYIYVVQVNQSGAKVRDVVNVSDKNGNIEKIELLSGANSLLLTASDNSVSQWFEVVRDGKRSLVKARDFEFSASPIKELVSEYYRKGFFAVQQDGMLSAYYTSERNVLYKEPLFEQVPDKLIISPRADRLLAISGDQWQTYTVKNSHPEIGFASLWQQVWYEGYQEPDYVWQSTSASDEFEPKLSLVPIVFGTLKAALYAMFFAIPLALAGAIYTAYFMSSRMRNVVKPTVEIMEALPTVILGFLAGLWLAPIVEMYLSGIVMSLILFPVTILLVGWGWAVLPGKWRYRIPNGFHIVILMPVIVLLGYGCIAASPYIDQWLFDGDVRGFLTNELGIGYDQRNALVVGIAMGFAVIPTIFSIAEDAIFSVPGHLTSGSLALGATHWQTLTKVVLLTASPGIFSALMMGLGRAVGETMIVLMATGNTPIMDWNILQGMRTLAATIAIEMPESEVGSSHYRVLFLAAFVLFIFTFIFNTIGELVRQRLREKYSSL